MNEEKERLSVGGRVIKIIEVVGALAIFAMTLHVLANVVGRFFFNQPLQGTLEYVQYYYMPILCFLGFVVAKYLKSHIEAPLIFDNLTWGNRRALVIVNAGLAVVTTALFAYFTLTNEALHGLEVQATAGTSTIPVWPVYFLVPAVFIALAFMYAQDVVRAAHGEIDERNEAEAALDEVFDESEFDTEIRK
ncbi:TRAP transporter small permease [Mycetocola zhadangensis]|uniref:TRAP transporter small permease n=1 Tax=Mycetocola zhadangensis TaxID=1164595 RepID=UPI003A4DE632